MLLFQYLIIWAKRYEMPGLNAACVTTAVFLIMSAPSISAVPSSVISEGAKASDLLAQAGSYIPTTYLDAKGYLQVFYVL